MHFVLHSGAKTVIIVVKKPLQCDDSFILQP